MSKYINLGDAIERLNELYHSYEVREWLRSLPRYEVSEDCISRAWVQNKLTEYVKDYALNELDSWQNTIVEWIATGIEDAPSVVPSRAEGEWQITDAYPHNVYCSECHKRFAQTHWAVWEDGSLPRNYCPNCGADMRGNDNE